MKLRSPATAYLLICFDTSMCIEFASQIGKHGKYKESLDTLKRLKKIAEESDMPFYVGQAYKYMGEYYLHTKQPRQATPMLLLAFFIFHQHGHLSQREEVRTLAAISAGNELFPAYVDLITGCDGSEEGRHKLLVLLRWNDHREIFWKRDVSAFSFYFEEDTDGPDDPRAAIERDLDVGEEEEIATTRYEEPFLLSFIENNHKDNVLSN